MKAARAPPRFPRVSCRPPHTHHHPPAGAVLPFRVGGRKRIPVPHPAAARGRGSCTQPVRGAPGWDGAAESRSLEGQGTPRDPLPGCATTAPGDPRGGSLVAAQAPSRASGWSAGSVAGQVEESDPAGLWGSP